MSNNTPPEDRNEWTIAEAKAWLRENWNTKNPEKCPCCTRKVQLREYKLTDKTVEILQELWDKYGAGEVFHLPTAVTEISMRLNGKPGRPGDVAMARHWNLVTKVGKSAIVYVGGKEVAGTQVADYVLDPSLGEFLAGDLAVPAWVCMFNNVVLDRATETVTVAAFRDVHVEVEFEEDESE